MPDYTEVFNSNPVPANLAQRLRQMPKVETHVHLEGATDAETVFAMSQRNKIALPVSTLDEWKAFYRFRDFKHFIEIYITAAACMRTPEDFRNMVKSFLHRQSEQHILYSEAYFSPSLHFDKLPDEEIIEALRVGANEGETQYGSRVRFIPDISREYPHLQKRVLQFALKARDEGIAIGLGIGGIEADFPPQLFAESFDKARSEGLHVVAHAGETVGAESVQEALQHLKAERIGHGIRALEDKALVAHLRETQVPMEVCPQSNYCLGVVPHNAPHPIRHMMEAGLSCTVNSDDPPMFSTDLNNEYMTLAAQGFSFSELWKLNLNTLNATFLPETEKNALRKEWNTFTEQLI